MYIEYSSDAVQVVVNIASGQIDPSGIRVDHTNWQPRLLSLKGHNHASRQCQLVRKMRIVCTADTVRFA